MLPVLDARSIIHSAALNYTLFRDIAAGYDVIQRSVFKLPCSSQILSHLVWLW